MAPRDVPFTFQRRLATTPSARSRCWPEGQPIPPTNCRAEDVGSRYAEVRNGESLVQPRRPGLTNEIMQKRHQIAALPVRRSSAHRIEVLLITSRETRRWVIPKGWPWPKKHDRVAAAGEAWEEAGVRGRISRQSIGTFSYEKRENGKELPVDVAVFVLEVTEEAERWPEHDQRRREWFPLRKAASLVLEPELKELILAYGLANTLGPLR